MFYELYNNQDSLLVNYYYLGNRIICSMFSHFHHEN